MRQLSEQLFNGKSPIRLTNGKSPVRVNRASTDFAPYKNDTTDAADNLCDEISRSKLVLTDVDSLAEGILNESSQIATDGEGELTYLRQ